MQLYNKLSSSERAILIDKSSQQRSTLSFYQYGKIANPKDFRDKLYIKWDSLGVLGRIYVAEEGINAQLSLPTENLNLFKDHLKSIKLLEDTNLNIAIEHYNKSFLKLKIKVRNKIVADGLNDKTFDVTNTGIHLSAKEFNQLSKNDKSIIVDMRNHYESEIGHFKNAITPDVDTFRESLDIIEEDLENHKEDKNLMMYCTGGIRCEKASAYFKHKGFKNVFQLKGGIIQYAKDVKKNGLENQYIGKNFVFDDRRAEKISEEVIAKCHQCGSAYDIHTNCANDACHLLFIQCDSCKEKMSNCCSKECENIHKLPYKDQKELRKGQKNSNDIFKKGRGDSLFINEFNQKEDF
jgi:UPF0176 protein